MRSSSSSALRLRRYLVNDFDEDEIIIVNRARCALCDTVIESTFRHDFVSCTCGAIAVDGGRAYLRRAGNPNAIIELSEVRRPTDEELQIAQCQEDRLGFFSSYADYFERTRAGEERIYCLTCLRHHWRHHIAACSIAKEGEQRHVAIADPRD